MTEQARPRNPPIAGKFEEDPRVYYDKPTGKWRYEEEESGQEHEWTGQSWVPLLDDNLIKAQQSAYSVEGVDETASDALDLVNTTQVPAAPVLAREERLKKRKKPDTEAPKEQRRPKVKANNSQPPRKTAVFVSNLPPNTTSELLASTFSKAGVLHVGEDGHPRIKLYYDEEGKFKGEALIMYFKEGSVDLAITLLDDTELELGSGFGNMRVRVAEYAKPEPKPEVQSEPAEKADRKPLTAEEKHRMSKRMRVLENKLAWRSDDDDDDERQAGSSANSTRFNRVVVLRGMFRLSDLEKEPELLLDLKEDVREEAETLGTVTSVVLYDREEDGIITVKFKDPTAATACVMKMDGRYFGGRKISASLYSGHERYRKSGKQSYGDDADEEEQTRLDNFADWLAETED